MARNFINASSQFINFPTLNSFLASSTTYTGAFRCRMPTVARAASSTVLGHRATTTTIPILFICSINTLGNPAITIRGDAPSIAIHSHDLFISANTWHSVNFTRSGTTVTIFLDAVAGAAQAQQTNPSLGLTATAQVFDIGAVTDGTATRTNFTEGDIAECAIWDVVLTQAEINSYSNGMSPLLIRPQNLIFYAPLWGTTLEADLSGSGGLGTLTGAPAISGFHAPVNRFAPTNQVLASLPPLVFLNGTVKELGVLVSRFVAVYSKATGELLAVTESDSSNGAFSIPDLPSEEFYVVALDNEAGIDFNADIIFATGVSQ